MKPCPSAFHADTSKLRPVIGFFWVRQKLDEVSNRIPPTSQARESTPAQERAARIPARPAVIGRHYLSNATCLIRPHSFCVFRRVKDLHKLPTTVFEEHMC